MPPVKAKWNTYIQEVLLEAGLLLPAADYMQTGGKNGVHTEYLGHILSEMQYLQRAYPDATW
jgi:ring-1,2-phenylacetyl-CoA epoxidase subunit PaaC